MSRILPLVLILATLAALPSCIAVGGTETKTTPQPTLGQQLIDLKSALDKNAITPEEYATQKSRLLAHR